ncbi:MAG: metallophosphoesterase [Luminiphilus sp.]|jgi:Icc protein|nr:metallophosphoesterase [Luminiphilus sp.]RZO73287.1 MAG: metallophosphoesterase [Halieaceae bacterium]CAI8440942.1 MAG: 3',5'-cyclic adenosine monophosphate phosphodiesterase CpdA [Halieaceae bacterium]
MNALSGVATVNTAASSRVVQLSDTHLMREVGGQLVGIDTDRSLAAVCRLVAAQGPIDALLLTGDLAGDEAEEAYARLDAAITPLGVPSFWLPGNHDAVWSDDHWLKSHFKRTVQLPHWDILMLNTQHPGAVAGYLAGSEIEALEQAVDYAHAMGRPLLVATHHPLMPVGCAWLDEIGAENAQAALQRLAPLGEKAVVISGHVHQDSGQAYHGVQCLTVPSTCIQFAPGSAEFQVDAQAPGCRMLTLHESGEWETAVLRVTDETFAVDLDSPGYA